ncbi:MAG TPA: alanine racemase [Thermoanaerobaculia bacterium]|jgi:D-serine deaminase-like pyridoxal phosphate-dependent protein|nr:alanine racemase [Thermoanaerobaculia bacterium]
MASIHDLPTPALLLDLDALERNLGRMSQRAAAFGVALRPHIKTHKSLEVARLQEGLGISGITVSTLYEARVFADHGFTDLTWAFPVILTRLEEIRELAERVTLRLVVDSSEAVDALERLGAPLHVWLKVDCGYHRAGVDPESALAMELARRLAESGTLTFDGLLTHSGHAYHGPGREQVRAVAEQERAVMARFAEKLRSAGIAVPAVSVGSTPALSVAERLDGVTEIRPGNYCFHDYTQVAIGSCSVRDCAVTVLASVVSCRPGDGRSVVDAGALALSKDTGPDRPGRPSMGEVFLDYAAGDLDPEARLVSLSQEHGILNVPRPVGSRVRILPNHSCLTVAQFDEYYVVRGEQVVDRWTIWRGR